MWLGVAIDWSFSIDAYRHRPRDNKAQDMGNIYEDRYIKL